MGEKNPSCKITLQAQVDRIGAQCQQMETDISSLMLRLSVSPKEEAATLHSERFCGLSQSCEQIVGQEEQLKKLMGMAGDSSNRRSVFMILGAPGMVRFSLNAFNINVLSVITAYAAHCLLSILQ